MHGPLNVNCSGCVRLDPLTDHKQINIYVEEEILGAAGSSDTLVTDCQTA